MSKLETNTIDTISGSTTLTLGGTNATTIAQDSATTITGLKSTGIDDNATSAAVEIDSSNDLNMLSGNKFIANRADNTRNVSLYCNNDAGYVETSFDPLTLKSAASMDFETNGSERMRIDSSGRVFVNATAAIQDINEKFGVDGGIATFNRNSGVPVIINRGTNDGELLLFRQNGADEGNISVSGSTVSYNGFTGTHWSRFQDNSTPTILKGTVLESLDEMCDWYNLEFDVTTTTQDEDGNDVETVRTKKIPHVLLDSQSNGDTVTYNYEGTDYQATIVKEADIKHMKSKVSNTVDAKNVYGVFVSYDEDGEGYNDFYVASVGSFVVRIKANETIAKGDLLQSNGDGTAKVQTDDNVKSSSFAKVLSTTVIETYDDGSFIVPCSLMC